MSLEISFNCIYDSAFILFETFLSLSYHNYESLTLKQEDFELCQISNKDVKV